MTGMAEDGFVPVENRLVPGIQAISQGVAELPAAFGLAIVMGVGGRHRAPSTPSRRKVKACRMPR